MSALKSQAQLSAEYARKYFEPRMAAANETETLASKVADLERERDDYRSLAGEVICTLCLEGNRVSLRAGIGWGDLFEIVDKWRERLEHLDPQGKSEVST